MIGVPPNPTSMWIPPRAIYEGPRPPRVVQIAVFPGSAIGIEECQPPPAVVVEPGACAAAALTRVGRVAGHRSQGRVPVALGAASEAGDRGTMRSSGVGDRHRVDGLELRQDAP